jgi:hypothetical protein
MKEKELDARRVITYSKQIVARGAFQNGFQNAMPHMLHIAL